MASENPRSGHMRNGGAQLAKAGGVRIVTGARTVGSFVPQLTRKAFERYGFPQAALITDWAAIVGADFARWTRPERLRWPRGEDGAEESGPATGAVLVVRVDGARGLEIEYGKGQLMERINAYFGFRAVTGIRILQAPIPMQQPKAVAKTTPLPRAAIGKAANEERSLSALLERLEASVAGRAGRPGASGRGTR